MRDHARRSRCNLHDNFSLSFFFGSLSYIYRGSWVFEELFLYIFLHKGIYLKIYLMNIIYQMRRAEEEAGRPQRVVRRARDVMKRTSSARRTTR